MGFPAASKHEPSYTDTKTWSAEAKVLHWLADRFPNLDWQFTRPGIIPAGSTPKLFTAQAEQCTWTILDSYGQQQGILDGRPHSSAAVLTNQDRSIVERAIFLWGDLLRLEQERITADERASRAEQLALVDLLTQLPNRRGWEQALAREDQRCRRANHPAAIVCLDLDRLKQRNDIAGHAAGDELLRQTADCLRRAIRAQDIAARLGGDEFGILLVECAGDCVPQIVARLKSGLQAVGVDATIGWAARTSDADLHATWQAADQALIAAKRLP
jgi:diguanylate cyclase (GGDEF)-like protein